MHYIYTWHKTCYLLNAQLETVNSATLTDEDFNALSSFMLTAVEKKFAQECSAVHFCNYKTQLPPNGTLETDTALLYKIVLKFAKQPSLSLATSRIALQMRAAVTWDTLLVQAIRSIDEIDKSINLVSKRLREWFEWQNPQLSRSIQSHERLATLILQKNQQALLDESNGQKQTPLASLAVAFESQDHEAVKDLASQIVALYQLRARTEKYCQEKMQTHLPNFTQIAGSQIGAKILSLAGNVKNLMMMTSSTIQVLGAEKALFRHLKTGANPPKYGVLFQHALVLQSKNKGKMARSIANTLSLCVKTDYFSPTTRIADAYEKKLQAVALEEVGPKHIPHKVSTQTSKVFAQKTPSGEELDTKFEPVKSETRGDVHTSTESSRGYVAREKTQDHSIRTRNFERKSDKPAFRTARTFEKEAEGQMGSWNPKKNFNQKPRPFTRDKFPRSDSPRDNFSKGEFGRDKYSRAGSRDGFARDGVSKDFASRGDSSRPHFARNSYSRDSSASNSFSEHKRSFSRNDDRGRFSKPRDEGSRPFGNSRFDRKPGAGPKRSFGSRSSGGSDSGRANFAQFSQNRKSTKRFSRR